MNYNGCKRKFNVDAYVNNIRHMMKKISSQKPTSKVGTGTATELTSSTKVCPPSPRHTKHPPTHAGIHTRSHAHKHTQACMHAFGFVIYLPLSLPSHPPPAPGQVLATGTALGIKSHSRQIPPPCFSDQS
jgi:hypothetical protein